MARLLVAVLLSAFGVGCGATKRVREPSVNVPASAGNTSTTPAAGGVRIAVITHGEPSSTFWAVVRSGIETAAAEAGVTVDYQSPDSYSVDRMRSLIDNAVDTRPDGLVTSLPDAALAPSIRRAIRKGVPAVTINSGSDLAPALGVLAHVGQPEEIAGRRVGRRLTQAGVRRALCVNQQPGNTGLDARCRGLERAMRAVRGTSTVLAVDDQDPATTRRIEDVVRERAIDGVVALNANSGALAVLGVQASGGADRVRIGVFDLDPEIVQAVIGGTVSFVVDQQPFLQGYLPVALLAQRARYGLFPQQQGLIETGPNFVTRENAAQALELSRRALR